MPDIRIVLVGLKGIERDIVRDAFQRREGLLVVGEVDDGAHPTDALDAARADYVIWHLNEAEVGDANPDLFLQHPRLKVLALDGTARELCGSCDRRKPILGERSPSLAGGDDRTRFLEV